MALETLANRGAEAEDDDVADRNQIVVIGRRQSGKTIFLASIYGKLWKSLDGMTAKALSGETHKQMMEINRLLQQGQWPSSTTGTSEVAMEIEYHGKKRLLVTLDFAGELFSKAFVREQDDEPAVRNLLRHIDRAAAVLLLIDPSVISGKDADAVVDDDFGVVQAVQRIRNWPGGDAVPIALVLTKMDRHQRLIDSAGGVKEFVRQHFPALIRTMREIPIFQVSAVQVDIGEDGLAKPRQDSALINIENPLRYCLSKIDRSEQEQQRLQMQEGRRQQAISMEQEERRSARRHKTLWVLVIAGALILWIFILAMIVIKRV
ncbi:MAG: hypothetical protein NT031_03370 [Planctomycetota bacterium]|nr:hypothetical protein [Planctomycetota bacterium]